MQQLTKLFIIDDELILRNGIKHLCNWEEHGFTIIGEASNGIEGLEMICSLRPDIVITDIIMSGMDGIELTQKIKELYPDISIVVLSSYDNFDYVKGLFKLGVSDYLLKPSLEPEELLILLNRLKKEHSDGAAQSSAPQYLAQLLEENRFSHSVCIREFAERGIVFQPDIPFYLVVGKAPERQRLFSHQAALAAISEEIWPHHIPKVQVITEQGTFCQLVQSANGKELHVQVEPFIRRVRSKTGLSFTVAVSAAFCSLDMVPLEFQKGNALLPYRFYFPEKTIIQPTDIHQDEISFPQKEFDENLDPLNFTNLKFLLNRYLEQSCRYPSLDVYELKKQVEGAIYFLIQALTKADFRMEEINRKKFKLFKQIDLAETCSELRKTVDTTIDMLHQTIERQKQTREYDLFYQITSYISENCSKDLKLSDLAQEFHLSYSYLSTLFHKRTKQHFSEFLNQVRINKAKHLLQTKKSTIQKVSEASGFLNQGYFSTIFKKHTGLSPKEYQKIYYQSGK